jgi:hypothetical protein
VFEGGGVKGIAEVGAPEGLQSRTVLPQIPRVGGTSAGVITAGRPGLNYSAAQTSAGFRDPADQHAREACFDAAWGLGGTVRERQAGQPLHSDDWPRTISMDTLGVRTTQSDLDDATKSGPANRPAAPSAGPD